MASDVSIAAAVHAAVAVARAQDLLGANAVPVGTGSNVIVHLRPHPVVARVMTGTVVLHDDPAAWLARELAAGAFLADRGVPVVAPTGLADPGPHHVEGLWLTLWEHVDVRPGPPLEAAEVGAALRTLHDALAAFPGDLPPRSGLLGEIDVLLAALADDRATPVAELEGLRAHRDRVADVVRADDAAPGRQPVHGDASASALLPTPEGWRWNDLEDVCVGRIEWDVAGVLDDARAAHGDAYATAVLAAYGRERVDLDLVARIDEVHDLYGDLWRRYRRATAGR